MGVSSVVLPSITRGAYFFPPVGVDLVGGRAPVALLLFEPVGSGALTTFSSWLCPPG